MLSRIAVLVPAILLGTLLAASAALAAEGDGQADLDKATDAKLAASTSGSINDLNEAIQLAESALKKGLDATNTVFAKRLLGSTFLQRGQVRLQQLATNVSSLDDLYKRRQLAVSDLEKALEFEPKQPQAYLWLAELNRLPGGKSVKEVVALLDKAIELGADDPVTKARAFVLRANMQESVDKKRADLDEAVRLMPDNAGILRARGAALADIGKPELALADLDKAAALEPGNSSTHQVRAIVLARLKRYDEAIAAIDKAREISPQAFGLLVEKAKIHTQQQKFDAALEDMNQALALDSGNVALLLLRAGVYQEKGDKQKALADMDEALKLKPNLALVVRTRALFLAQNERMDEAIGDLEKLLKRDPKDVLTLLQLGMFYSAKKNSLKAIEIYQKVLALTPDEWRAVRGLADSLLNVGRQAEALAQYEKAIKLDPKDDGVLNNLAWLLCTSPDDKIRNGRRALELATEACKLTDYKVPHILSTLAAAYAEVGDFDNAVKWVTKGLEIADKAKETDKDGDKETKEALKKELENYRAKKPIRESLSEEKEKGAEKKAEKKPDAKK
jgi:tetratricopeptide (TPR) repeat protein